MKVRGRSECEQRPGTKGLARILTGVWQVFAIATDAAHVIQFPFRRRRMRHEA